MSIVIRLNGHDVRFYKEKLYETYVVHPIQYLRNPIFKNNGTIVPTPRTPVRVLPCCRVLHYCIIGELVSFENSSLWYY